MRYWLVFFIDPPDKLSNQQSINVIKRLQWGVETKIDVIAPPSGQGVYYKQKL